MTKALATLAATASILACAVPALADDGGSSSGGPITTAATGTTDHSAVVHGQILSNGTSLDLWFQYGKTTAYGSRTSVASALFVGTILANGNLNNLDPGTVYHYRFVTSTIFGTSYGKDLTFTTNAATSSSSTTTGNSGGSATGVTQVATGTAGLVDPTPGTDSSDDPPSDAGTGSSTTAPPAGASTPEPELGRKVVAGASSGSVAVKAPGASRFAALAGNAPVPVGSIVDARRGTVNLVTALSGGATQTGTFHGAVFQVKQAAGSGGLTDLVLRGGNFGVCKSSAKSAGVVAAGRKRVVRRLWGNDHHGRFRTRGSNSIATVRGTSWVTTDRCDGTLTSVSKGAVSVRDLHRNKTVLVRAGHSYLARGRR